MNRWLQCPAALIISLIALVFFLRSAPRERPESAPPETMRSERLLLRRTASTADESSAAESTSLPSRLAAEHKSSDSEPPDAAEPSRAHPTQPLPGTHLDPASYALDPPRWSGSPAGNPTSGSSMTTPRGCPASTAPTRTATARSFVKHRVVDGDDLRRLAQRYLNNPDRAIEIFHANRDVLVQPDLLPLGVELQIPISLP